MKKVCCPTCHGHGEISVMDPMIGAEIEVLKSALMSACQAIKTPVTADGMVRSRDAAELVGVAPGTLKNWRNGASSGCTELPYVVRGKTVLYRLTDIARWQLENSRAPEF